MTLFCTMTRSPQYLCNGIHRVSDLQARVTDIEMELELPEAKRLMVRRATVFQRRPFFLHAQVLPTIPETQL